MNSAQSKATEQQFFSVSVCFQYLVERTLVSFLSRELMQALLFYTKGWIVFQKCLFSIFSFCFRPSSVS